MNLSVSSRPLCIHPARKESTLAFVWLVVTVLLVTSVVGWGQSLTPPVSPEVAPVISEVYPSDADGDRINDALRQYTETVERASSADKRMGVNAVGEATVAVELVFNAPVTQQQIDAFLAAGGEITYLYKAVSYGWNGRIRPEAIEGLPAVMGPTLVLVEPVGRAKPYMDRATQIGRVRPIWQPGFAGQATGFHGSPNTTIAFIDSGVDRTHADLSGRCVYWNDLSGTGELEAVDYVGHGTHVAGVALGTGQAGGADVGQLRYTYAQAYASWLHIVNPIELPREVVTISSRAYWKGSSAWLDHASWMRGSVFHILSRIGGGQAGQGEATYSSSFNVLGQSLFSILLANWHWNPLEDVVIVNTVSPYPGVGDGFNDFRGVAPRCQWAAVNVDTEDEEEFEAGLSAALDDLVFHRLSKNIKIINISAGLIDWEGLPTRSRSLRDKVNSAVRAGVIVVVSAGNSGAARTWAERDMADPARAAMAITVGASNDENELTDYSTCGFCLPGNSEDYKPDLIAPGGSAFYSGIMSVDSGTCDGSRDIADKEPDDYANGMGTSLSSPFVAGCAALVIEAMEKQGVDWDFESDWGPCYVKMVLCATASQTNADRESGRLNPTLDRTESGTCSYPPGKDAYEGYGLVNADAAVEAISLTYELGTTASEMLGAEVDEKRVWARRVNIPSTYEINVSLSNPPEGDFDLYLYSLTPSDTGTPVILACSAGYGPGDDESLRYAPDTDTDALLVVKRVSGSGTFELSTVWPGPPLAGDVACNAGANALATITLAATDDGAPNPPAALTYTIVSLPKHGQLERLGTALPITKVPTTLEQGVAQVLYRPDLDWMGADSFKYLADDGGTAPLGGRSNTATVEITVVQDVTLTYQVSAPLDDAHAKRWNTYQKLNEAALVVGQHRAGMRFGNVEIPRGARIVKANLKICAYTRDLSGQVDAAVYAEAADDVDVFSNNHRLSDVTTTNASQAWDWTTTWSSNTWHESPDIAHVIQEVVDRPGWSANNAIVILCIAGNSTSADRSFWSYDGDPGKAAQLEITYVP